MRSATGGARSEARGDGFCGPRRLNMASASARDSVRRSTVTLRNSAIAMREARFFDARMDGVMMVRHTRLLVALAGAAFLLRGPNAVSAETPVAPPVAGRVGEPTVPLVAHRATYRIVLFKSTGTKSPTSARGRVSYEFTGSACDGYSQIFRQITELQPAEGATRSSDMRSATFEDGDEKSFSFDVKTISDSNPPDVVDGHAVKKGNDVLAIQLSKPSSQTVDVDNAVLFPTAHLKRILAAAKAGQHILGVKVFDGSDDGKKVYDTTTIIGRPITAPADDMGAAHVVAMEAMRRWPVSISYFEEGRKDESPAYSLGFELYENGVSRALRFDYGDFVLGGDLVTLDLLPTNGCPR